MNEFIKDDPLNGPVIVGGVVHKETGELFFVNVIGRKRAMLGKVLREYNSTEEGDPFTSFSFGALDLLATNVEDLRIMKVLLKRKQIYEASDRLTRIKEELDKYESEMETIEKTCTSSYISQALEDGHHELKCDVEGIEESIKRNTKFYFDYLKELNSVEIDSINVLSKG